MRLVHDAASGEVSLAASAPELERVANVVAAGEGLVAGAHAAGEGTLAGIEAERTSGPGVLIRLDARRRLLVVGGDPPSRTVLADNVRAMAAAEDGGHLHVDWFPGHFYLAEGSLSLVVGSPHGGMPTR